MAGGEHQPARGTRVAEGWQRRGPVPTVKLPPYLGNCLQKVPRFLLCIYLPLRGRCAAASTTGSEKGDQAVPLARKPPLSPLFP